MVREGFEGCLLCNSTSKKGIHIHTQRYNFDKGSVQVFLSGLVPLLYLAESYT
jgi:hypothetical protein